MEREARRLHSMTFTSLSCRKKNVEAEVSICSGCHGWGHTMLFVNVCLYPLVPMILKFNVCTQLDL